MREKTVSRRGAGRCPRLPGHGPVRRLDGRIAGLRRARRLCRSGRQFHRHGKLLREMASGRRECERADPGPLAAQPRRQAFPGDLHEGGHPPFSDMHASRLHEREVRADLEKALPPLGWTRWRSYWLHRDDPAQPAGALVELLETLRREGRILAYGVSNWSTARFAEAAQYAADHGYTGFCGLQNQWSLARVNREQIADQTLACMDGEAYRLLLERRGSLGIMAFSAMARAISAARRRAAWRWRAARIPQSSQRKAAGRAAVDRARARRFRGRAGAGMDGLQAHGRRADRLRLLRGAPAGAHGVL